MMPRRPAKIWIAALALLAACTCVMPQDRLAMSLAQYDRETDPVRKARVLAKIGNAEIDLARQQLKAEQDVASLQTLESYRDKVIHTVAALKAAIPDAEKKPGGFKELQIGLRETIRRMDDLILSLPVDKRPFFREVRTDLFNAQNELIDALFPRQAGENPKKTHP